MYLGTTGKEKISAAHKNYCETIAHENETRMAFFHLDYLEAFVRDARKMAEAKGLHSIDVGLLLLRGGICHDDGWYEKIDDGKLQINMALVADDGDGMLVLEPGGESTGLCPKNCGRIQI